MKQVSIKDEISVLKDRIKQKKLLLEKRTQKSKARIISNESTKKFHTDKVDQI